MQLHLDELGRIPANYPKTFYRVEDWFTGSRVADFTTQAEAEKASYASNHGGRYDHKVSTVHLTGA